MIKSKNITRILIVDNESTMLLLHSQIKKLCL